MQRKQEGQCTGNLHSARTKSLSFTNEGNVSLVSDSTSDAEAMAARPRASAVKDLIVTWERIGLRSKRKDQSRVVACKRCQKVQNGRLKLAEWD